MQIPATQINAALPAFSGASVSNSTATTLADAANTFLPADGELFDIGGYHDTVVNNERLTAPSSGYYMIGASVTCDIPATAGMAEITILRNLGDMSVALAAYDLLMDAASQPGYNVSGLIPMSPGDYVRVRMLQACATPQNLDCSLSAFWIYRVGV